MYLWRQSLCRERFRVPEAIVYVAVWLSGQALPREFLTGWQELDQLKRSERGKHWKETLQDDWFVLLGCTLSETSFSWGWSFIPSACSSFLLKFLILRKTTVSVTVFTWFWRSFHIWDDSKDYFNLPNIYICKYVYIYMYIRIYVYVCI